MDRKKSSKKIAKFFDDFGRSVTFSVTSGMSDAIESFKCDVIVMIQKQFHKGFVLFSLILANFIPTTYFHSLKV